jgi:hypothetical protein
MVSTCVGTREDVVPCRRNDFFDFPSLSSLISMTRHHFANVAPHLMKIEITINIPLGLPLGLELELETSSNSNPIGVSKQGQY